MPPPAARDERLEIAFYSGSLTRGGAEVSLRNLLLHLTPAVAATVVGVDDQIVRWIASARPGTPTVVVPPAPDKWSIGGFFAHRRAFARLSPDVIHLNLSTMADARWAVAAATTVRGAATVVVEQLPWPPEKRSTVLFKRWTSRFVAAHVAVGQAAARRVEDVIGLRRGSIRVIHNGVPDRPLPPRATTDGSAVVVGTLARLDPVKGLDVLIPTMAVLPGTRLVVVGDGPARSDLVDLARRSGVSERVEFRGWTDEAPAALAEFDVFVLPSRNEGFPLSVVEAMLARLPVVASDVGSVSEAVVDGETGLLVPPDDGERLGEALRVLLEDADRRKAMGEAGRARALGRFTAEVMARSFDELYREVSRGGRRRRRPRPAGPRRARPS